VVINLSGISSLLLPASCVMQVSGAKGVMRILQQYQLMFLWVSPACCMSLRCSARRTSCASYSNFIQQYHARDNMWVQSPFRWYKPPQMNTLSTHYVTISHSNIKLRLCCAACVPGAWRQEHPVRAWRCGFSYLSDNFSRLLPAWLQEHP
jgi:hypothetical protein